MSEMDQVKEDKLQKKVIGNMRKGLKKNPRADVSETITGAMGLSDAAEKKRKARKKVMTDAVSDSALVKEYGTNAQRDKGFMTSRKASGGTVRMASGGPVVDSYDYD